MANATIIVDSYEGALKEAGDIVIPLNEDHSTRQYLCVDRELVRNKPAPTRESHHRIQVRRHALEDPLPPILRTGKAASSELDKCEAPALAGAGAAGAAGRPGAAGAQAPQAPLVQNAASRHAPASAGAYRWPVQFVWQSCDSAY